MPRAKYPAPIEDNLRTAREDLAAAFRLAVKFGFHEGICNHFSLMVPGSDDLFLINPQGLHWSEITATNLALMERDGNLVEGERGPEATAFHIHWRIHRGATHARCVLHTHMPFATTLTTLVEKKLLPIHQTMLGFHGRVAYDDGFKGLALSSAEGDRMMAALADKAVLFLENHGVVVVGPSVAHAFNDLYYLERACQLQVYALSTGRPLKLIDEKVIEMTARQFQDDNQQQVVDHFAALKRVLDADS